MAINLYSTRYNGNIALFDTEYTGAFETEVPYIYFNYATTIPDIRTMEITDVNSRIVSFGFTHGGINIPTCQYYKDPNSQLDYGCNWANWLQTGENITEVSWSVNDPSLVIEDEDNNGGVYAVMLSGGQADRIYTLTSRIRTDQDRIEDRSMYIVCAKK